MKKGEKGIWLLAVLTTFVTILLICYVSGGYTMGNWTVTSWLFAAVIVVIAVFCTWCPRYYQPTITPYLLSKCKCAVI